MALALKIDVVTARFDAMLNEMAKLDPRVEFSTIIRQMAIRVMQGAANREHDASIDDIKQAEQRRFDSQEWTSMDGKKYLIQGTGNDGHRNHYPDAVWNRIQIGRATRSAQRIADKVAARGLAKQSWYNLAVKLGGEIQVPAYVKTANYKGHQYPGDVSFLEDTANGRYGMAVINASPIAVGSNGRAALLGAMQAEVGYFTQNMAHGFYQTAGRMAQKYPGIYVLEAA